MIDRSQLFRTFFPVDGFVSLGSADDDVLLDLFEDLNPCWPANMFPDRADGFRAGELEGMLLLPVCCCSACQCCLAIAIHNSSVNDWYQLPDRHGWRFVVFRDRHRLTFVGLNSGLASPMKQR